MANPKVLVPSHRKPSKSYRVAGVDVAVGQVPPMEIVKVDFVGSAAEPNVDTLYERYRQLVDRVADAFGDEIVASKWLSTPSHDFNARPPLEVAQQNGYDVAVLEPVLIRIEHGVDF